MPVGQTEENRLYVDLFSILKGIFGSVQMRNVSESGDSWRIKKGEKP